MRSTALIGILVSTAAPAWSQPAATDPAEPRAGSQPTSGSPTAGGASHWAWSAWRGSVVGRYGFFSGPNAGEVGLRFDYPEGGEFTTTALGLELARGDAGGIGTTAVSAAAGLWIGSFGLVPRISAVRGNASNDDARWFGRASIAAAIGPVEVGYWYQRAIADERPQWLSGHGLVVSATAPIEIDL